VSEYAAIQSIFGYFKSFLQRIDCFPSTTGSPRDENSQQLKINTMPGPDKSFLVHCWVDHDGQLNLVQRHGKALAVTGRGRGNPVAVAD
jgi:hypothetical protein